MDKATIHSVFAFLRDHYWDSLEDQRTILEAHFAACEKQLTTLIEGRQAEASEEQTEEQSEKAKLRADVMQWLMHMRGIISTDQWIALERILNG